jgi:signal transduction histidine kinase/CheY-like chemotaxis protein/HPt (histidine-containing phosphotransfer) domain-containing protein
VLFVLNDVTELKRTERELRFAQEVTQAYAQQTVKASETKSMFLANMSHEIRTPLNGVTGMAALLADTNLNLEQREYVDMIQRSGETLLGLINDILDFSKIEAGKLELEHHPFELHTCIEEALELLSTKAAEKKLDLAYVVEDAIPKILVSDVTRLRQILVNLISNAVKFTSQGEVVVEVTPAAHGLREIEPGHDHDTDFLVHPEQWLLHFCVRDTGVGIPLDKQHRLFKSFQQVDASTTRHYGGTGLGLAICKRLVELMGGRIWVDSDLGRGAAFHFTILTKASAATTPPNWQLPQQQLAGKRLLVIEDNTTNQQIIQHRAEQWGMTVETAATSREAFARLAANVPFDVVLVDLQLPDMDGLSLADEIRKQPYGRYLPLVLISAVRLRSDDTRPSAMGISVFVHKPIRPGQLLDSLCRAMSVQLQREKKAPSAPALDSTFASRLPLRLLLADDNPINQKVGLSVLHRLGYRADVASNGMEVMKALEQKPYDVLFLDVQMPEMDGLECARQICQRWNRDKRPVVIAMTGNALMGDREKCLAAGMDDYISKPVRITELQTALERWGPTKSRKFDTNYFLRHPQSLTAGLINEGVINELQQMPPNDGRTMLSELIDLYLESAPARITQIYEFASDPQKLAFHAHALKSMSLNLGCTGIIEVAQQLEDHGRAGDLKSAPELIRELESTFSQTKAQLLILRNQSSSPAHA